MSGTAHPTVRLSVSENYESSAAPLWEPPISRWTYRWLSEYDAVYSAREFSTFRRELLPPFSVQKILLRRWLLQFLSKFCYLRTRLHCVTSQNTATRTSNPAFCVTVLGVVPLVDSKRAALTVAVIYLAFGLWCTNRALEILTSNISWRYYANTFNILLLIV